MAQVSTLKHKKHYIVEQFTFRPLLHSQQNTETYLRRRKLCSYAEQILNNYTVHFKFLYNFVCTKVEVNIIQDISDNIILNCILDQNESKYIILNAVLES